MIENSWTVPYRMKSGSASPSGSDSGRALNADDAHSASSICRASCSACARVLAQTLICMDVWRLSDALLSSQRSGLPPMCWNVMYGITVLSGAKSG